MTTATDPRPESDRPEFAAFRIDAGPLEVREHVEANVKGLHVTDAEEELLFRTRDGMLLAAVRDDGDGGSVFEYRDGPATLDATRKADRLAAVLGAELE